MPSGAELLEQADQAFGRREYAEATALYAQAASAAEKDGNTQVLVQALAMVARGHLVRDDKEKGQPWLARAEEIAQSDEPQGWSRTLGVRGRFQWKDEQNAQATETFRAMYDYCLAHDLFERAVDAAHMVAITGTAEQQIEWARKGIAAAEKGNLDGWLGPLWNNLGATFDELEQLDDALQAYQSARDYHWKVGAEHNKLVADWAVGRAFRRLGRGDEALQWLRPVLAWAERRFAEEPSDDRAEWVGLTCWELGEIAVLRDESAGAADLLARARQHLEQAKMQEWDAKGWDQLNQSIDSLPKSE